MFVALRSGLAAKSPISGVGKELCKIHPRNNVNKYQAATLVRAAYRNEDDIPLVKPFPYHNTEYTVATMLMDTHKCRVHEHSKLIVVDGQVASGKNQLAKELAKEFDFLYLAAPTFDDLYISHYGFDFRTLDSKVPKAVQSWDIERFLQNPTDINTAAMQCYMLMMRQAFYMNALAHVLCTGQGVVTVRSPWSDTVFARAMAQSKYISPGAFEAHTDMCLASLWHYLKPHLIIYLDVPVDVTKKNIKKRGLPHELNAKALTDKYLGDIENNYKSEYLAKLGEHCHLLIYDWSEGGETEAVVDDIESLNFDTLPENQPKLKDWRWRGYDHKLHIKHYTYDRDQMLHNMEIMRTDVPELLLSGEDAQKWDEVADEIPDRFYAPGYNLERGEKLKDVMMRYKHRLFPDNVTPLMKKYKERKAKYGKWF